MEHQHTPQLVIVESPAKAKTIEKFLGKDFVVKSSFGHIRDLEKNKLSIDVDNGYKPNYIISPDKQKLVNELEKAAAKAQLVWLASDEDREGEAISWHLVETLNIPPEKSRRIAFHEITRDAILNAIQHPRTVDMDLVNAQQARRVIDRLVGYNLSPLLWRKIAPKLSAGRVQSVALRLVVEKEREIIAFQSRSQFKIEGRFCRLGHKTAFNAHLDTKFATEEEARAFLLQCLNAQWRVADITREETERWPAAPFTTSTLQQEASRKLGFSVNQTMSVAQRLYEAGHITYMRTDSVHLSNLALQTAKQCIMEQYGETYYRFHQYDTKTKGAQEAHEAIRPTFMDRETIEGTSPEKRLYDLIRKRTLASQMMPARLEKTTITIADPALAPHFLSVGEVVLFDGYKKIYQESEDDDNAENGPQRKFPVLNTGEELRHTLVTATEVFTKQPYRYSEASLVKKLEELGIGRPSTYAPTITTILQRDYVNKGSRPGTQRICKLISLSEGAIVESTVTEAYGAEKNKLIPTDLGMQVAKYLEDNFPEIMDYNLTARIEKNLDEIAEGGKSWTDWLGEIWPPFKQNIDKVTRERNITKEERHLGTDPKTGRPVIVRMGRYGAIAQIGTADDPDKKMAGLHKDQLLVSITLEEALQLFALPRLLGKHQDLEVSTNIGRYGPYIKWGTSYISLPKEDDPYTIDLPRAIAVIAAHVEKESKKHIAAFPEHEIEVINGRYGPYIAHKGKNYKIPRNTKPETLTAEACLDIISKATEKETKPAKTTGKRSKTSK